MSAIAAGLFIVSALVLLGTPGPGIAALVAVGKQHGFNGSLRFFTGLLIGLAIVAGAVGSGVLSAMTTLPGLSQGLTIAACLYLAWLAWAIGTSPVGEELARSDVTSTFSAGLALGLSNPKAYLAFITLFASQTIIAGSTRADAALKWTLMVAVIILVDIVWLYAGDRIGQMSLSPDAERKTNIALGLALAAVAVVSLSDIFS